MGHIADHVVAGIEFFLSGCLIALTALVMRHLYDIKGELSGTTWRYMSRMTWFLFALSFWWFCSRLAILGFESAQQYPRLNTGRTFFVAFQLWVTWGLIQFLRARQQQRKEN